MTVQPVPPATTLHQCFEASCREGVTSPSRRRARLEKSGAPCTVSCARARAGACAQSASEVLACPLSARDYPHAPCLLCLPLEIVDERRPEFAQLCFYGLSLQTEKEEACSFLSLLECFQCQGCERNLPFSNFTIVKNLAMVLRIFEDLLGKHAARST